MENYRTFIAVPIRVGEEFLQGRSILMDRLSGERISWVDSERYHVTIRFLGETPLEEVRAVRNVLRSKLELPASIELSLHQAGSFGPRKKPRVVWVGFRDPSLFENLRAGVDEALDSIGIPPPDQPFRAHLTLGRIRSLKELNGYYNTIDSLKDQFAGKVLADRMVFYRSELGSAGPVYTPLEVIKC